MKQEIEQRLPNIDNNSQELLEILTKVVNQYTYDLDEIMSGIDNDILKTNNPAIYTIEHYFLKLSSCLYTMCEKVETLGIYDSISKSNDDIICVGMRESIIRMLNKSDHTMRRQCLKLLKLLPFLIDLKIKDIILFFLTDQTLMEDEKSEINDILALKGKNDSSENLI